jgi:hypothetical protein
MVTAIGAMASVPDDQCPPKLEVYSSSSYHRCSKHTLAGIQRSAGVDGYTCEGVNHMYRIRTRARRFLRCIPSQVCFELLTRTSAPGLGASCAVFLAKCALNF